MITLKKIHKIILVLTVCAVLFSMFATSSFADSVNPDTYYYKDRYMPLCSPAYFMFFSKENGNILTEVDTTVLVPTENIYNDVGFIEKSLLTSDGSSVFARSTLDLYDFAVDSRKVYGYNYHSCSFHYDFYDFAVNNNTPWILQMEFNDVFVPSGLVKENWNWLCNFKLCDYTYGDILNFEKVGIGVTFSYLQEEEEGFKMQRVSNKEAWLPSDTGFSLKSEGFWKVVKEIVLSEVPESSYKYGIAINHINFQIQNPNYENGIQMAGSMKYVHPTSVGDSLALQRWQDEFGSIITELHSPTILESVTSGVNAIWNLKIFNTFTIGNIFSACVGILMTRWLLKMFAGG